MYRRTVRPKKSLGQHFLKDLGIAERIAGALPSDAGLPVLEVGGGTGVLTQFLVKMYGDLKVVEIDSDSVSCLSERFPELRGRIVEGDFLKLELGGVFDSCFMVIGNYPYCISSQIFFRVLEYRDRIPVCAGMVQKEVAERLAARAGGKSYGIVSVLLQAWYDVEYLFTVGPEVFDPPPKVRSAVVRMTRNGRRELGCDESAFRSVVRMAFNRRRKTLRNSLKSMLDGRPDVAALPVFDRRPEQLLVEEFVELTNLLL
jgi:16S rRNA (adenine1518-N6/adenine1519-N6)-dimethyltransferase